MEPNGNHTDITIKNINGRTVLGPVASLTFKNCDQMEKIFNDLLKRDVVDIIVDMKQVPFMDSRALELLVEMQTQLDKRGTDLMISHLNDVCQDILICVRLQDRFKIISSPGTKNRSSNFNTLVK